MAAATTRADYPLEQLQPVGDPAAEAQLPTEPPAAPLPKDLPEERC